MGLKDEIRVCECFLLTQENSSWRLRCLESLRAFVSNCTEELIWLNEKEEEELAFDWSENNNNMAAKREQYAVSDKVHSISSPGLNLYITLHILYNNLLQYLFRLHLSYLKCMCNNFY